MVVTHVYLEIAGSWRLTMFSLIYAFSDLLSYYDPTWDGVNVMGYV